MSGTTGKRQFPERGAYKGKVLAVLTSGGDSQGMNATIRCVIRVGIYLGCKTYFIREGLQGMVDGGCNIERANWASVSSIIHRSGTVIGSARSMDFMKHEGRLKAACNLVHKGITNLVVIGGDGSLTGTNLFREEWPCLLCELHGMGKINDDQLAACRFLNIVGVVGTIDNDFCGSDYTIGTDSALHRISEAASSIIDTSDSLQRTFIVEVMGRYCGYLAIMSGLILEADYVFCPELPPPRDWPRELCEKLNQGRKYGRRLNIIILSEGALDIDGQKIVGADIKKIIDDNLEFDARVTVLGHIQRGGNPSAFDRIMGCRMGADATLAVLEAKPNSEPMVITLQGNIVLRKSLMECVTKCSRVRTAYEERNLEEIAQLRGQTFVDVLETYKMFSQLSPPMQSCPCSTGNVLAVMHIGDPACGMNAAVHSFVRHCLNNGDTVLGIHNGIEGLIAGDICPLKWWDVTDWITRGGTILGTRITLPQGHFEKIAQRLQEFKIQGLLIIGGFGSFEAITQLVKQREQCAEFCIPMLAIPATISNNVPGSDISIGSDTSLNMITIILDCLRQSAQGTRHRVFVIETFGGYCGYLATFGAFTSGADVAYIYEENFDIKDLQQDVIHMASKMCEGVNRGLILRSEHASENYTADFITRLYAEEGKEWFSTRMNKLGHTQQGGTPSPRDRGLAIHMGESAFKWFKEQLKSATPAECPCFNDAKSACVLGFVRKDLRFTPVEELIPKTCFNKRIPKCQWWMKLRPLLKIISKHTSAYTTPVDVPPTDIKCTVN